MPCILGSCFRRSTASGQTEKLVPQPQPAVALGFVTLNACPFASAVLADPTTVCELHLGLAQGAAEAVGGIAVEELVPQDPRHAHCRLRCHVTAS